MVDLRVKRVGSWIEVYVPRFNRRKDFSYAVGLLDKGDTLIITDVYLSPSYRKKGLGRLMVERLIDESGATEVRVNNVQPKARGFWTKMQIKEVIDGRRIRRIERLREDYFRGEGYD